MADERVVAEFSSVGEGLGVLSGQFDRIIEKLDTLIGDNKDGVKTVVSSVDKAKVAIEDVADNAKSLASRGGGINERGEVVGVNTSVLRDGEGMSITDGIKKALGLDGTANDIDSPQVAMKAASDAAQGLAKSLGGGNSGLSKMLGSLSGGLGSAAEKLKGLGDGFAGATKWLGRLGGAAAVAVGAFEVFKAGMDKYQEFVDVAVSQTGSSRDITLGAREWLQVQTSSAFSGLSEDEAAAIQQGLIAGRVPFESANGDYSYNEGFSFAQSARLNYALDAGKATDLYVKSVVRGSMTVDDLNQVLESLSQRASETGITMSELTDTYLESVDNLSKKFGEGYGSQLAAELSNMGLTPEQQATVQGLAGNVNMRYGSHDIEYLKEYKRQGYSDMKAMAMAGLDVFAEKNQYGGAAMPISVDLGGGRSIFDYIKASDWDGLEGALQELRDKYDVGEDVNGVIWPQAVTVLREALGADIKESDSPSAIVDYLKGIMGELSTETATKEGQIGTGGAQAISGQIDSFMNERMMMSAYDEGGALYGSGYYDSRARDIFGVEGIDANDVDMLKSMLDEGVISEEQIRGLSKEQLWSIVNETGDTYLSAARERGGGYSRARFLEDAGDSLSSSIARYSSDAFDASRSSGGDELHISFTFSDEFSKVISEKNIEYNRSVRMNEGVDVTDILWAV